MKDFLKVYGLFIVAAMLLIGAAIYLIRPAPPGVIRLATGVEGGGYDGFGQQYKRILEREGITVELVRTNGSVDNLELLSGEEATVDVGFVQGGLANPEAYPQLLSLGGIFPEPVWMVHRKGFDVDSLEAFDGVRASVGPEGSGTEALARDVLTAYGVWDRIERVGLNGSGAVEALRDGKIDFFITVSAGYISEMAGLLAEGDVEVLSFRRAEAFQKRFPFMIEVGLPEGVIDIARNLPSEDITLIAPVANLIVREDFHPALAELLVDAASEVHGRATVYHDAGVFPTANFADLPLMPTAERYYENGPSFLRKFFPFWAANLIARIIVIIIPLLTLLLPLSKILPGLLRFSIRRKILKFYKKIRQLEYEARMHLGDSERKESSLTSIETMIREVGELKVPLGYADDVYRLRQHLEFVFRLIEADFRMTDGEVRSLVRKNG